MTRESDLGDVAAMLEADQRFHLGLVALGDNELLTDTVERIRNRTRLYSLPRLATQPPLEVSVGEHHLILDAVERGDMEACERLTRQHIMRTRAAWVPSAE